MYKPEWLIEELELLIRITQEVLSDDDKSVYYKLGACEGCIRRTSEIIEHYKKENRDD